MKIRFKCDERGEFKDFLEIYSFAIKSTCKAVQYNLTEYSFC